MKNVKGGQENMRILVCMPIYLVLYWAQARGLLLLLLLLLGLSLSNQQAHSQQKAVILYHKFELLEVGSRSQGADPPPFLYAYRRQVEIIWTRKKTPSSPLG